VSPYEVIVLGVGRVFVVDRRYGWDSRRRFCSRGDAERWIVEMLRPVELVDTLGVSDKE